LPASPLGRALGLLAAALVAALAFVACSPLGTLNALARSDTFRMTADVAYGPLPRQKLDIYAPTAAPPAAGWPSSSSSMAARGIAASAPSTSSSASPWPRAGILTLVADYRLYPRVRYPGFVEDSALALAWGLEHAKTLGGDPHRIFVMGHSAGGYNAAMLALDPRWLAATGHKPASSPAGSAWPDPTSSCRSAPSHRLGRCSSIPTIQRGRSRSTMRAPARRRPFSPRPVGDRS